MSPPSNWLRTASIRASNSSRLSTTRLCGEAHAPSRLSTGRLLKYSVAATSPIGSTLPSTLACRSNVGHQKVSAAIGFAFNSSPFRLSRFVKKASPRSSRPFNKTIRTEGRPSLEAVASAIAVGSCSPTARASLSQAPNCTMGSLATSPFASDAWTYSSRRSARERASCMAIGSVSRLRRTNGSAVQRPLLRLQLPTDSTDRLLSSLPFADDPGHPDRR